MSTIRYCAYLRVSTAKQGIDGFGIDAQRASIAEFIRTGGSELIAEFVEAESGAHDDRAQLKAALALCRARKATLLVAKLDRLARSVSFVSSVMDSDVSLIAADNPHASRLVLHMLAAVAEFEREQISQRTKAAMAAAKARGVRFGTYGKVLAEKRRSEAIARAQIVAPLIAEARRQGAVTLEEVAQRLNALAVLAPKGGMWSSTQVWRVEKRLKATMAA